MGSCTSTPDVVIRSSSGVRDGILQTERPVPTADPVRHDHKLYERRYIVAHSLALREFPRGALADQGNVAASSANTSLTSSHESNQDLAVPESITTLVVEHDVLNRCSTVGIKACYLREFIIMFGGRDKFVGKSVKSVVDEFVKSFTLHTKLSVCDQLLDIGRTDAVGQATLFFSYAWTYMFLELVDALDDFVVDDADAVLWLDIFSNTQHTEKDKILPTYVLEHIFSESIKNIGRVVVIFDSWRDPCPTKRLWCVYEWYVAHATDTEVTILMNRPGINQFLQDLRAHNFLEIYRRTLADIGTGGASATFPEDDTSIREIIHRKLPKGLLEIDHLVINVLETWINNMVAKELLNEMDPITMVDLRLLQSELFKQQGRYREALDCAGLAFDATGKTVGERRVVEDAQIKLLLNIIETCILTNDLSRAEECLRQCDMLVSRHYGTYGPLPRAVVRHRVTLFLKNGRFCGAQSASMSCISAQLEVLGYPDVLDLDGLLSLKQDAFLEFRDLDLLSFISQLGVSLMEAGRPQDANCLFVNIDGALKKHYGTHFRDTVQNLKNVALSLKATAISHLCRNSLAKCEAIFIAVLVEYQRFHGNSHPATLDVYRELAHLRTCLHDYSGAEDILRRSLDKSKKAHGLYADHTLQCATDLAKLLEIQGKYAEGKAILSDHYQHSGTGFFWNAAVQEYFALKKALGHIRDVENDKVDASGTSDTLKSLSRERILGAAAFVPFPTVDLPMNDMLVAIGDICPSSPDEDPNSGTTDMPVTDAAVAMVLEAPVDLHDSDTLLSVNTYRL
jgi:hypothetical protein